ncbi:MULTISPECIES: DUF3857 domain-containing protein [Flavobacteriaceae]|uniref:DUF3857 domain-containing protein n=1 Tax=Flavobacteriaceae TaxID=49546 RepID=UPI00234A41F5|nr:transglutaminase domain-containing protein [Muricauda sp. SP22]MDC6361332.1 DUF3857 domain-containing protein [Muricauda sp. SP22]
MIRILTILIALVSVHMQGQDLKFGKVSKEELLETTYAKDTSAPAAYLLKKRQSYYTYNSAIGLELVTEVHERIKIYNADGFDYATKAINLYESGASDEKATSIKGYTYTLEGDKVIETKLDKGSIFKSKQSKNRNQVKFTMPNVKAGSVVEYQYKITSPFVQSIDEFVFQHFVPIKRLEAEMRIPEYFKFNQRQKGFLLLAPKVDQNRDASLGMEVTKVSYNLQDIPALKNESFVSNIINFRSGVTFEIKSLEIPGSTYDVYSKTWDDVAKTVYEYSSFGDEMKKSNYFEEELNMVLQGASDPHEKAKRILAFVKEKVKWNSFVGYTSDEGTKKAYKEGTGNCADINLMLVSMLNHANVPAYPVLVSTRDNGIPLFPTLQGYNYVVAVSKINGEYHLFDATNAFSTMDVLPTRTLNWYGRMISENGNSEEIDLMPKKSSMDAITMTVELNEDGSMEAKCRQQYTNHNALVFRNRYNKGTEESFLGNLEKEMGDIEISEYNMQNNLNLDKPVVQNFNFYKEDAFESISGKLYLSPMFHLAMGENPFKSEKREYPIDYGFPWEDKYLITINIPEGYKVEHLPEPFAMVLPDNLGQFKYNISTNQNFINVRVEMRMNTAIFPPSYYLGLKEFYRQVVEKESEKVVLAKI